jgi:ribonuclease-3
MSDCLEALIGAIYLDTGFKYAEKKDKKIWTDSLDNSILPRIDSKTQLQEYSLKKFKINFSAYLNPVSK